MRGDELSNAFADVSMVSWGTGFLQPGFLCGDSVVVIVLGRESMRLIIRRHSKRNVRPLKRGSYVGSVPVVSQSEDRGDDIRRLASGTCRLGAEQPQSGSR